MNEASLQGKSYETMFKYYQLKAYTLRFTLQNLSEKGWINAIKAIKFYKKNLFDSKQLDVTGINSIIIDANRAFVLHCCSMINYNILNKNPPKIIEYARIATYDCLHLIEEIDPHSKQVLINMEYSLSYIKRVFPTDINLQE